MKQKIYIKRFSKDVELPKIIAKEIGLTLEVQQK